MLLRSGCQRCLRGQRPVTVRAANFLRGPIALAAMASVGADLEVTVLRPISEEEFQLLSPGSADVGTWIRVRLPAYPDVPNTVTTISRVRGLLSHSR